MGNIFIEGTYKAGIGLAVPSLGGIRPMRMGQWSNITEKAIAEGIAQQNAAQAAQNEKDTRQTDPGAARQPIKLTAEEGRKPPSAKRDRFQWSVNKICSKLRKFANTKANEQAVSRVIWAYVRHAKASEESVVTAVKTLCPELAMPAKPVKRVPESLEMLVPMTYQEAVQVSKELDKALETATVDEVVSRSDATTEGALSPEDLPAAETLQEEIKEFVAAGNTVAVLTVPQESVAAAEKAIDQASTISKEKTTKGLLIAGAVVGAGALAYFLL
jgi:hypothetical protein